jgi:hypothetical protein
MESPAANFFLKTGDYFLFGGRQASLNTYNMFMEHTRAGVLEILILS